jgi:hypothetical protein
MTSMHSFLGVRRLGLLRFDFFLRKRVVLTLPQPLSPRRARGEFNSRFR